MARDRSLIGDQFRGLPMEDLIGGPLFATPAAQEAMARAQAEFLAMAATSPSEDPDQDPDA